MTAINISLECFKLLEQEATRRGVTVDSLLEAYARELEHVKRHRKGAEAYKQLQDLWAKLPKDFVPPTDEEVQKLIDERRMRKSG